ncbi:WD repeat-containing protein 24 [Portunus trituberculatus]|uniref:WD repeat-containing protein 24 n=1 Tax=Portunus trituberculatus TaxID=210409 RepID=A0A5B7J4X2_PORTR|nr:WD repeat-containing protein 24 [Portunus trituberculatus]
MRGETNCSRTSPDLRVYLSQVSFHPSEAHLLISGSLDGFMKLFDLRRREATQTYTR